MHCMNAVKEITKAQNSMSHFLTVPLSQINCLIFYKPKEPLCKELSIPIFSNSDD